MGKTNTLRGMATVSYYADDVKAARKWYTELLSIKPYFERPDANNPAYVEFRIGDFQHELGLIDKKFQPAAAKNGPGGSVLFWHVDNVETMHKRLLQMGCKEYDPITKREAGFVTASVIDPFGNVLGIMHNPHYLEILESMSEATAKQ
jgi:predicted enzyme related to lactoylglutathione lyase